jgi:uncharacterized protein (TIGR02588 family)
MKSLIKGRKAAELVTLTLSVLLIGTLMVFLLMDAFKKPSEIVVFRYRIKATAPAQVIPIEIYNKSDRAVTSLKLNLKVGGELDPVPLELEYLAGKSSQTVYRSFETVTDPASLSVLPVEYTLD